MKKFKIRSEKTDNKLEEYEEENPLYVIVSVLAGLGIMIILVCIVIFFIAGLFWLARL